MANRAAVSAPHLPGDLCGAEKVEVASLKEVPNDKALADWLKARGLSTDGWGEGSTKSVGKLFKELKLGEADVEVYRTTAGDLKVIRSTHVLRGKVCSQKSYDRGIFLFNTWQQFGDGRKRTRNGLLSEKLNTSEIPLQDHLHETCKRAVEEEEMQCVVEAAYTVEPGAPPPERDPNYRCPLIVENEHFCDYTIELEESKSFPGLMTAYHLYTVDIICSGLPSVDFNTLEFDEPDKEGRARLKYVHAWNWLRWPMIQRYLFEGSKLKESKRAGSFQKEEDLGLWLKQLGVNTEQWGKDGFKSVGQLFDEVQREEAQLELWGRHDGVPLLMRVAHVLQIQVVSEEPHLAGKFLFQTWQQSSDGRARKINRLMSKKLSCSQVPFDETLFKKAAQQVIQGQLSYLSDVHFQIDPARLPNAEEFEKNEVGINSVKFVGKHFDIEESPSFKGMSTMYHLYTMEIEVDGLPSTDFSAVDFSRKGGPLVGGFRWMDLPATLDILHANAQALGRQEAKLRKCLAKQREQLQTGADRLTRMEVRMKTLFADISLSDTTAEQVQRLPDGVARMAEGFRETASAVQTEAQNATRDAFAAEALPPAMLSKMALDSITSESFFEEHAQARRRQSSMAMIDLESRKPAMSENMVQGEDSQQSGHFEDSKSPLSAGNSNRKRHVRFADSSGPKPWALGLALALCAAQVATAGTQLSRARASGGSLLLPGSSVLAACGVGLLVSLETFRSPQEDRI